MKIILTDTETITDGDLSLEPIEQFFNTATLQFMKKLPIR